jgi:glucosamine--fructose-6-phosphate aminotransferase (isomerizing)
MSRATSHFQREVEQQPEVLRRILDDPSPRRVAEDLREKPIGLILTLARGSSDNAVTFFTYLAGQYLGVPVASLPPSLLTLYRARLRLGDTLAIGVSQSGESTDVVEGLATLKHGGAITVAVSNQPGSSLEREAVYSLLKHAGPERAVAASKTFSGQMMVLASLVAHWSGDTSLLRALEDIPVQMERLLENRAEVERAALRFTHARSAYVLGRGLSFGPALEVALKLKETCYLHAQAYSSAEFQHGPIAALHANDPVVLLANQDASLGSNKLVVERLRELGADLTVISGAPELLQAASAAVPLPQDLHPVSSSFLTVLAGQLLTLNTALSKGLDPDSPRHLSKITKTV